MASSLHSPSQRFFSLLTCVREEFESRSDNSAQRFNIYLQHLKGEFELKSLEIESLRKERDEYRNKVEVHLKKLQDIRRNFVCERCRIGIANLPQITVPSKSETMKTTPSSLSASSFQAKSFDDPDTPDTSRGVDSTTRRSTQRTTLLLQKLYAAITPTRPSQSVSHAVQTKPSDTILADSQTAVSPSSIPQASVGSDSGLEKRGCSIKFNNEVEKELDVEVAYTLFDGQMMLCVKFSWDGKYLAAGCADGKAYIYDVHAGTLTCVLRNLLVSEDRIRAVCFTRDGKYLATSSPIAGLYIWEISKKYVRNAFKGHTQHIYSHDCSPNGRLLVSTSGDNTVRLWNMHDGASKVLTEENPTIPDSSSYNCAVFSPNGRYVAASHIDGMARIWDVCTGHLTRRVRAHPDWAICVAFMPDGKGLVTAGWDNKLRFWDISSLDSTQFRARSQTTKPSCRNTPGREEQTFTGRQFTGHESIVSSLAVSPDGKWVASGSFDGSARIWGVNGSTQCCLEHNDRVRTVDFSPAGCYLASGGDGTLRIWKYSNVTS